MDRKLVAVVKDECSDCDQAMAIIGRVQRDNVGVGLVVEQVDVWLQRARELRVTEHPTVILETNGRERVRHVGRTTHRQLLRKLLPHLYPGHHDALAALRDQLDSPAEEFPTRRGAFSKRPLSEKVEQLSEIDLFAGLSNRQLRAIARVADEIPVAEGQILMVEGETGTACYVIIDGTCVVRRRGRKLSEIGPGASIGEMALIDNEPRGATVTATSDMELLVIDAADFAHLVNNVDGLARALLAQMARRLRAANRRLVS